MRQIQSFSRKCKSHSMHIYSGFYLNFPTGNLTLFSMVTQMTKQDHPALQTSPHQTHPPHSLPTTSLTANTSILCSCIHVLTPISLPRHRTCSHSPPPMEHQPVLNFSMNPNGHTNPLRLPSLSLPRAHYINGYAGIQPLRILVNWC